MNVDPAWLDEGNNQPTKGACHMPESEFTYFTVAVQIQAVAGDDAAEHAHEVIQMMTDAFTAGDIPATVQDLTLAEILA